MKTYNNMLESVSRINQYADVSCEAPSFRALVIIADVFRKNGIPCKFASIPKVTVFSCEEEVVKIIADFANSLVHLYKALKEEFGCDQDEVFENMLKNVSLTTSTKGCYYDD